MRLLKHEVAQSSVEDITDRKKAEETLTESENYLEKLRESEEKFRNIFESANDCLIYLDKSGRILDVNRKALEVFGGSKKEVLGRHFTRLGIFSPGDIPRLMSAFAKGLAGKQPTLNVRIENKRGQEIHLECLGSTMKTGDKFALMIIARDVTERRKAEEALRESEEKYRTQFEEALDAIFLADAKTGIIVDCNRAASELVGREKSELVGKHQRILHPPEEIEGGFSRTFRQNLKEEGQVLETPIITKKGEIKDVAIKTNIFKFRGKKLIQGIFRDITERMKAEEELRFLKEFNEGIINSISESLLVIDPNDYTIIAANEAALKQLSLRREELIGKTCYKTTHHRSKPCKPPEHTCPIQEMLRTGKVVTVEHTHFDKNNNETIVEISASPLRNQQGKIVHFVHLARDITERKKAEEELTKSEEKYRSIVELAPDSILTFDMKGVITSCNTAATRTSGYSKDELVGKHFTKIGPIRVRDIPKYLKMFSSTVRGKVPKSFELTYRRKDGTVGFGEVRFSLMREQDKATGIQAILRDITERKKMEEALRKTESESRTLLGNLPQKIFFKDKNSVYISCNENYARDLKIKSHEIAGKSDYDFYPKELAEKYRADDKRIMKSGKTEDIEEEYIQEGQKVFVHTVKTPVKDENGNVVGILGIFWDITESKKAEKELIRLSSAVKMSTDSIVISDLNGKIIDLNEATLKMYGTDDKRDLIGKSSFDPIAPEEREKALVGMKETLERGYTKNREYQVITKDGRRIPVEMSAAIMKDADGKPIGFVGISRDITERRHMEKKLEEYSQHLEDLVEKRTKELREAQERLIRSERLAAIGEVATMVGHDLRNPLQSIENATYYLNNELQRFPPSTPIPQKTTEMLQVLSDSVNYADRIIRDLQEFSVKKKPIFKKTSINTIVKETLSQVETPENVKIATKLGHLPQIEADKDMMKRVFLNLAINGMQAMEKGGTLKISTKKAKGFVEVSFKDTGIGMSKEKMEKLFTPFFTTKARGMGMGLPICKRFVESHGGSIQIESQEGKGSTFTVKLPIQQESGGEK